MNKVINIAKGYRTEIEIGGVTYKVSEGLKEVCKKLLLIYEVCIVVTIGVAVNVAPMIGSSGLLSDILFVAICLVILSFIFKFIASAIFKRVVR